MSTFEEARAHYGPLCEVYIAPEILGDGEWILCGEILPRAMDEIDARFENKQRIPISSRPAKEVRDWIRSAPDELNRALNATIPDAFGTRVKIYEWYPATPEEREEVSA